MIFDSPFLNFLFLLLILYIGITIFNKIFKFIIGGIIIIGGLIYFTGNKEVKKELNEKTIKFFNKSNINVKFNYIKEKLKNLNTDDILKQNYNKLKSYIEKEHLNK